MSGIYAKKGGATPDRSKLVMYAVLLGVPALCALVIYLMAAAENDRVQQNRESMRETALAVAAYEKAVAHGALQ